MSRRLKVYTSMVSISGGILILFALTSLPANLPGLLGMSFLVVIAEWTNVALMPESRSRVSISSIISLASIYLFGISGGIITSAVSGVMTALTTSLQATDLDQSKRASTLRRSAFNTGMLVVSTASAGVGFVILGGRSGLTMPAPVIPFLSAAIVDHLVNVSLLVGVISIQTERPPLQVWIEDFLWAAPIAVIGAAAGSFLLAYGYNLSQFLGLLVFVLPVLLLRYAYWVYVRRTKMIRVILRKTTEELQRTIEGLSRNQQFLSEISSGVQEGQSNTIFSQLAQQAKGIEAELAAEDDRLKKLQHQISQAMK